jgi:hypothetical protein
MSAPMSTETPEPFPDGTVFGGVIEKCNTHGETFVQFVVINGRVRRVCTKCKKEIEAYENSRD